MTTVRVNFDEKLEGKEVARVYALIHGTVDAVGGAGETIDASDVNLKTIRSVQLTSESSAKGVGGSVETAGSIDNSFVLLGTPQAAVDIHATILGQ